jgi:hypothetical protein
MSRAATGGVSAASAFCPVFWTPRARPAQAGPAYSATAVKASPLVLTTSTAAASRTGTASAGAETAVSASASSTAVVARARIRIGPIRLPTRSDQYPAASREAPPATAATASSDPAAAACQPRVSTRKTSANVATVNCGTTSSALAAWIRHSTPVRYGDPRAGRASAPSRAGSRTTTTTSTAAARQNPPRKISALASPRAASDGSVSAATATPSGCELCRMPIASPRSRAANQPRMSRPLAA